MKKNWLNFGRRTQIEMGIREANVQVSNGSHVGMASKSQIFEFLHHSLNFGAFFIVLIFEVHFAEPAEALRQQNQHYKSKQ